MRRVLRVLAIAVAALAISPSVLAQSDDHAIGSRLRPRDDIAAERSKLQAVRQAHAMASCQVHKRGDIVRNFLDATDARTVEVRSGQLSRELGCIGLTGMSDMASGARFSSSLDLYRGNLAEALLARMTPIPVMEAMPLEKVYTSPFTAVSGREPPVEEMAVCVAQTAPSAIVALIQTVPESAGEMAAIQAALPAVKLCLVANARLTVNRQSLRAALAEALYHRAAGRTVMER